MQMIKNGEKYRGHIMFTRCLKHVLSCSLKGNSETCFIFFVEGKFWLSSSRRFLIFRSHGPCGLNWRGSRSSSSGSPTWERWWWWGGWGWWWLSSWLGSRTLERCELQLLNFLKQERFLTTIVFLPCNTRSSWDLSYMCLGTSVAKFLPPWRVRCWGS